MSKTLAINFSAALAVTNSSTNQYLNNTTENITVKDNAGYTEFEISAGATISIKPANMEADMEFLILAFYSGDGSATNYGRLDIKITHASGDSTFRMRKMGGFSVLGTDTAVQIINPDATNAQKLRVSYWRQS